MKNYFFQFIFLITLAACAHPVFAQGMMNPTYFSKSFSTDPGLLQEELAGKDLWMQIQNQQLVCATVSDEQFRLMGEFFMGQMMGDAHRAMNNRLLASLGKEASNETHITFGKRLSGCNRDAAYTNAYLRFMPMMGMMFENGNWDGAYAYRTKMMQNMYTYYGSNGWDGWVIICLWWILIGALIVLFVRWLMNLSVGHPGHTALEHLKIRYAKGDIDKREFDRKKKELK